MSSGLVRSICSSVRLGEQLLRSSWAPGPCGSSTLANTRKPMASKCRAVACPKPESQPARAKRSPAVGGQLSPAPRDPLALPLHPQGPTSGTKPAPPPSISPPPRDHPGSSPCSQGHDLALGHSQVAELLFSIITHTGGRKHSLICNPITP